MIFSGSKNKHPSSHYLLNEASGTTVYDTGSTGTNLTSSNVSVAQTGDRRNCYSFNGTTSHVTDSGSTLGDKANTDSFTICGRFKTGSAGTITMVSKYLTTGTQRGWNIYLNVGTIVVLFVNDVGATNYLQKITSDRYDDDYWHCFVVTYDGSSNASGINIYVDGLLLGTSTPTNNLSGTMVTSASFSIGSRDGTDRFFDGELQDIRIIDEELTRDDAENISYYGYYQNIYTKATEKLVFYNHLSDTEYTNNSFLGGDGVEVSAPAYELCKFGNGYRVGSYAVNDRIYFPFSWTDTIVCDFWWRAKTISSGRATETNFLITSQPAAGTGQPGDIRFVYDGANERWRLQYYTSVSTYNVYWDDTYADEELMHFRLIMSTTAQSSIGGDKIALYKNGSRLTDTSGDGEGNPIEGNITCTLHLGNYHSAQRGMRGVMENFKIWNYANADLGDREIQFPLIINGTDKYTTPLQQTILWNTLFDTDNVENSFIGVNGTVTGGTFTAGKFKDGFRADANSEYLDFVNAFEGIQDTGSIELWIVPKNTFDDGSTDRVIWMGGSSNISLFYDASENLWCFDLRAKQATFSDTTVPDGTPIHILCSWDNISGDSVRIWVDGVEGTSATGTFSTLSDTDLRLGNNMLDTLHASSVLENLKVHNYQKLTAFDRESYQPIDIEKVVTV